MPHNHSQSSCGMSVCHTTKKMSVCCGLLLPPIGFSPYPIAQMDFNAVQYVVQPHTTLHDCTLYLTQYLCDSGFAPGSADQHSCRGWASYQGECNSRMTCRNAVRLRTAPHAVNRPRNKTRIPYTGTPSLQSKTRNKTLCLPFSVTRGCEDVEDRSR